MAIQLANEYQKKVADRFTADSKTESWAGKAYDFVGVHAIQIWTIDDPFFGAYNRDGDATYGAFRFGKITEVGDTYQTLEMGENFAIAKSIDKANAGEQYNIKKAQRVLKLYTDRGLRPIVDMKRLYKWATGHGLSGGKTVQTNTTAAALVAGDTSANGKNILEAIFEASAALSDKNVPLDNRVLFVTELDYVKFQLGKYVVGGSQLNANTVRKGYTGTIDNIAIVRVPSVYMPANVGFIMKYKGATVDPIKMKTLRVQKDPLGIDGDVLEMHVEYDSFVVNAWCDGVYVYKTASADPTPPTGLSTLISTSATTTTTTTTT